MTPIEKPFKDYTEVTYEIINAHPYFKNITKEELSEIVEQMDYYGYKRLPGSLDEKVDLLFEKLQKEKTKENMKKVKEFKVKKENLLYINRDGYPTRLTSHVFLRDSIIGDYFSSLGLLDNEEFFEKIYEEDIKVGDYIFTTPGCSGYGMNMEDENKVFEVEEVRGDMLYLKRTTITYTKGKVMVRTQDVRKATEEEIKSYKEENALKAGDWAICEKGFFGGYGDSDDLEYGGSGYKTGYVFKIGSVEKGRRDILWPSDGSSCIYVNSVRKATPQEIKEAESVIIGDYKAEFVENVVSFGCQHFVLDDLKTLERIVSSPINGKIEIEGVDINIGLIKKLIGKLS